MLVRRSALRPVLPVRRPYQASSLSPGPSAVVPTTAVPASRSGSVIGSCVPGVAIQDTPCRWAHHKASGAAPGTPDGIAGGDAAALAGDDLVGRALAAQPELTPGRMTHRGWILKSAPQFKGLPHSYDWGPQGTVLRDKLVRLWTQAFAGRRPEVRQLDSKLVLPSNVWKLSGHLAAFQDLLAPCQVCQLHARVEELLPESSLAALAEMAGNAQWLKTGVLSASANPAANFEGQVAEFFRHLRRLLRHPAGRPRCPNCGARHWGDPQSHSLLAQVQLGGSVASSSSSPSSASSSNASGTQHSSSNPSSSSSNPLSGLCLPNENGGDTEDRGFAESVMGMGQTSSSFDAAAVSALSVSTAGRGALRSFLRPELTQGALMQFREYFNNFNRRQLPLGIAQVGKAFRAEARAGPSFFRNREFEQAELLYFAETPSRAAVSPSSSSQSPSHQPSSSPQSSSSSPPQSPYSTQSLASAPHTPEYWLAELRRFLVAELGLSEAFLRAQLQPAMLGDAGDELVYDYDLDGYDDGHGFGGGDRAGVHGYAYGHDQGYNETQNNTQSTHNPQTTAATTTVRRPPRPIGRADLEFRFPHGWGKLAGVVDRGDHELERLAGTSVAGGSSAPLAAPGLLQHQSPQAPGDRNAAASSTKTPATTTARTTTGTDPELPRGGSRDAQQRKAQQPVVGGGGGARVDSDQQVDGGGSAQNATEAEDADRPSTTSSSSPDSAPAPASPSSPPSSSSSQSSQSSPSLPRVIQQTLGVDRLVLALLSQGYAGPALADYAGELAADSAQNVMSQPRQSLNQQQQQPQQQQQRHRPRNRNRVQLHSPAVKPVLVPAELFGEPRLAPGAQGHAGSAGGRPMTLAAAAQAAGIQLKVSAVSQNAVSKHHGDSYASRAALSPLVPANWPAAHPARLSTVLQQALLEGSVRPAASYPGAEAFRRRLVACLQAHLSSNSSNNTSHNIGNYSDSLLGALAVKETPAAPLDLSFDLHELVNEGSGGEDSSSPPSGSSGSSGSPSSATIQAARRLVLPDALLPEPFSIVTARAPSMPASQSSSSSSSTGSPSSSVQESSSHTPAKTKEDKAREKEAARLVEQALYDTAEGLRRRLALVAPEHGVGWHAKPGLPLARQYQSSDLAGTRLAIVVDSLTLETGMVCVRERDTRLQIMLPMEELVSILAREKQPLDTLVDLFADPAYVLQARRPRPARVRD